MALRRDLHWPSLTFLATGLLSVGPVDILAQTSTVVCNSSFSWMDNSKGQSPCLVGAYLQGACNNGQYTVNPLPSKTYYTGPNVGEQNDCQCSTVTYCAMSACGACQNTAFVGWDAWSYNCTTLSIGFYLPGIPDGTAVPAWAFEDMVAEGYIFNVTLAQSVGDNPESTATNAKSTGSLAATSTMSGSLTVSPSASSTSSLTSSGSSSDTGAIAGGVVGGVVGVALIAAVAVFFVMKKKKRTQNPPPALADPPPGYTDTILLYSKTARPKLYDPSDPSTFPTSLPPITVMTESSNNVLNPATNNSTPSVHPGGHYTGAPEI